MLLNNGQSLDYVLEHIYTNTSHEYFKGAWKESHREFMKGVLLSDCLRLYPKIFPTFVPDMISIGERTGTLSQIFNHIGKIYEEEIDIFIKQVSSIIEPVLMLFMGLVVGSIALSIILPIYEITNHLSRT